MIDWLFAFVGAAAFIAFCTVLIVFVPHIDLIIVVVLVILMICFDFLRALLSRRNGSR